MAFTDALPFGMFLAAPAFGSNTCGGTVTALDNGDEVSLVGGVVGAGLTCAIVLNVSSHRAGGIRVWRRRVDASRVRLLIF